MRYKNPIDALCNAGECSRADCDGTACRKAFDAAWLDGFNAATVTAESYYVRVDGGAADACMNAGSKSLAALLRSEVNRLRGL